MANKQCALGRAIAEPPDIEKVPIVKNVVTDATGPTIIEAIDEHFCILFFPANKEIQCLLFVYFDAKAFYVQNLFQCWSVIGPV
jgi:hypothetical protein